MSARAARGVAEGGRGAESGAAPCYQLVTRAGCHLCDTAHEQLEAARQRWGFRLAVIDIDTDEGLVTQYCEWVPVVTVNGKVRFRGQVNEVLLTRLLQALQRGNPEPETEV